jgi:hypothetical protein
MKAIILKELRENLKLALPAFLVLTALFMFAAWDAGGAGLANEGLLRIASIFYAVFGAALGWLQIHRERPRDLWAFLVHRPITRTGIFFAKVAAGLLLYAVSVSLPMLGYIIWVKIPGNVAAPFEWAMVVPDCGCFLLGIVWYFAAMLTSLGQARWYASRGLGLAAAFPLHAITLAFPGLLIYWQFDLALLLPAALLATAVWGSIHADVSYRGQPAPARAALATVLACGSTVLIVVALAFLSAVFHQSEDQYYAVTKDGEVFHVTARNSDPAIITDLSGARLKDPNTGRDMDIQEFNKLVRDGQVIPVEPAEPPHALQNLSESPQRYFYLPWRNVDGTLWHWTRHGLLVGYDVHTRRFVGNLSPQGPVSGFPEPKDCFLRPTYVGNQLTPRTLATASALYQIDLRSRSTKRIFTAPENDRIGGTKDVSENATVVVSQQSIQLLTADGKCLWQVPHDPDYRRPLSIRVFLLDATNQYALWIHSPRLQSQRLKGKIRSQMVWVSTDQGVLRRTELPTDDPPNPADALWDKLFSFLLPPEFPFMKPLLFRLALLGVPIQWNLVRIGLAAAALCAAAGWLIGGRYHFSVRTKLAWAVFHLCAGVPGLLAFLSIYEWPARETCPNCNRLRIVDREQCEHCAADFAPPEKDGTEIFEADAIQDSPHGGFVQS